MYSGEGGGDCFDFFLSFFNFFAGGEDSDVFGDFFLLLDFLVDFFFSGLSLSYFFLDLDLPFLFGLASDPEQDLLCLLEFSGLLDIRLFDPLPFPGVTCLDAELYVPYLSGLLETVLNFSFLLALFDLFLEVLLELDLSERFLPFELFDL